MLCPDMTRLPSLPRPHDDAQAIAQIALALARVAMAEAELSRAREHLRTAVEEAR